MYNGYGNGSVQAPVGESEQQIPVKAEPTEQMEIKPSEADDKPDPDIPPPAPLPADVSMDDMQDPR